VYNHLSGIVVAEDTVRSLEALDGTPVLDVKPVLGRTNQR
jgi:tRNA (Thr-GGU) A37 N-methylase